MISKADSQTLTFVAVKKSLGQELAKTILSALLTIEFCNYFVVSGAIQPCLRKTADVDMVAQNGFRLVYPEFSQAEL